MAIEGPLRELGIHDVFQLLDLSRKTGRLRVSSALRDNEGTVSFRDGSVVGATIRSNPHPLGAVMLRAGKITEPDLARARAEQQRTTPHRRLGEILMESGLLTRRELERFIRQQIEAVIFELLSWQEGFFSFTEASREEVEHDVMVIVPTESLLMEGARRLDEWTKIQLHIPHLGVVPFLAPLVAGRAAPQLDLLPNEWEVLSRVDGTHDLHAIAAELNRSEFEIARIAFGLGTTDIVHFRDPRRESPAMAPAGQLDVCLADAREALAADRLGDAVSQAAAAVALAPGDAEARSLLARALLRTGREVEGEEELRQALAIDPRHPAALMEQARLCAKRGELTRAIDSWQRLLTLSPDSPFAEQARQGVAHARELATVLEAVDA